MTSSGTHTWQWMYPPLQCHAQGWLPAREGHEIHWEVCGNPLGAPALFVHGGPGAGCRPADRRWFDPARYRIVLFDQRGAGRSRPAGEIRANTTGHLVDDMEALRQFLNIERWLLFGGSWGATLALAYAQRHPERVRALVLRGVFTATLKERRWLYTAQGAGRLRPVAWDRLVKTVPVSQCADPVDALVCEMHCGDLAREDAAAQAWLQWEQDLMDSEPEGPALRHSSACDFPATVPAGGRSAALAAARLGSHFAKHDFFLNDGQLLLQAQRLRGIPAVIVQGARDLVTPAANAVALHNAWPGSRLVQVPGAGHASSHGDIARQLIAATDEFRAAGGARTMSLEQKLFPKTMETSDER